MGAPPGTMQCPACGRFPRIGMLCEFCNAPLPPPPKAAPAPPPAYGPPPGMGGRPMAPGFGGQKMEDTMSVGSGFTSWFQVVTSPRVFFREQAGYTGIQGALGFLLAYAIVGGLVSLITRVMQGGVSGPVLIGGLVGIPCGWVLITLMMFIWGGLVHLASKMVGGQGDYSCSFRAATYALGPAAVLNLIASLLTPVLIGDPAALPRRGEAPARPALVAQAPVARGQSMFLAQTFPGGPGAPGGPASPGASGPSSRDALALLTELMARMLPLLALMFAGWIWSAIVMGIGIAELHGVGGGAAAGAVIIANILVLALIVLLWLALAGALMGAIAAAGAAGGAR